MVKNISAEELRELIKNKKDSIEIIDVRQPEEYAQLHIEGTKLIPLGELLGRINDINWDKEVIFMCQRGIRSAMAANIAVGTGKNVGHLEGGILAWQKLE